MLQKYLLFLCFLCLLGVYAQEVELFKAEAIQLQYAQYPWGEELSLEVKGFAHNVLNQCVLIVTIFYEKHRVAWHQIYLESKPDAERIEFYQKWAPVHKASQEILAGVYIVKVEFDLASQPEAVSKALQARLKGRTLKTFQKKFQVGSPEKKNLQKQQIQEFYFQKIQGINELFDEIFQKRKKALSVEADFVGKRDNPFGTDGSFAQDKWLQWFNSFLNALENHKKALGKYPKQVIVLMYPQTHSNLEAYCSLAEQMGKDYANSIYRYYARKSTDKNFRYVDPYGFVGVSTHLKYIRRLHEEIVQEMPMDLQKKLGYFPPPPVFRE